MNFTFEDNSYANDAGKSIDAIADSARLLVVGDPVRVKEYEVAESDAKEFKAAGYTGPVPTSVASWTLAKSHLGWTDQQACDDILAASVRWYGALAQIRGLRLVAKEQIKVATGKVAIDTIVNQFKATLGQLMQGVQ